jgi:flagellar hook-associated protein 2
LQQYDFEQIQTAQNSLNAYQQFNQTLGSVQSSLLSIVSEPFTSANSGITSSNNGVAYISPSAATNLAVNVTQLAQQQQIQTGLTTTNTTTTPGFTTNGTEVYQTGTLTLQIGNVNTTAGSFTAAGQPVTINVTDGSLAGVVKAINGANSGVTASVITDKNGNSQIQITGPNTGAANGFVLTGADTGGSGNSLATLNYSDSTAANAVNYASIKQAQDAQYTVNGTQTSSPTNLNVPIAAGINLNLLTIGSTVISQPQASTGITNAANSLVSTINGVFQVLQQFTGANGPLANDPTTVELFQNDVDLALGGAYGTGTNQTLSQLGITQQADGTYAVNAQQLSAAYEQDPTGTQTVLSQVASALVGVVQQYSGQYGQVTQQISYYQSQVSIYTGQFQTDQTNDASANSQASAAVQAYNLLAGATGGSQSPYTSQVA